MPLRLLRCGPAGQRLPLFPRPQIYTASSLNPAACSCVCAGCCGCCTRDPACLPGCSLASPDKGPKEYWFSICYLHSIPPPFEPRAHRALPHERTGLSSYRCGTFPPYLHMFPSSSNAPGPCWSQILVRYTLYPRHCATGTSSVSHETYSFRCRVGAHKAICTKFRMTWLGLVWTCL